MSNFKDDLLVALLDCGYGDLSIFDDCKYDFSDIVEMCQENFGKVEINALARCMFEKGISDINSAIEERIENIIEEYGDDITAEQREELAALKELSPVEDIESFHNYLDTSIWINSDKRDVYKRYMQAALDEFEMSTGFCIN